MIRYNLVGEATTKMMDMFKELRLNDLEMQEVAESTLEVMKRLNEGETQETPKRSWKDKLVKYVPALAVIPVFAFGIAMILK
jgi:hypothetical protein